MRAPLIPHAPAQEWTIFHSREDFFLGQGEGVAFTSRKALEDWRLWPHAGVHAPGIAHTLGSDVLSHIVNRHVLILDEVWSSKFDLECPQMDSAQQGMETLEQLQEGSPSPAQLKLCGDDLLSRRLIRSGSADVLSMAHQMQQRFDVYRRLETWSPDGVATKDGYVRLYTPIECDTTTCLIVDTSGEIISQAFWVSPRRLRTSSPALSPGQVMVIPNLLENNFFSWEPRAYYSWKPEAIARAAPDYLSFA